MDPASLVTGPVTPRSLAEADLCSSWRPLVDPLSAAPWSWYGVEDLVRAGDAALERCVGDRTGLPADDRWSPCVTTAGSSGFEDLVDLDVVDHLLATRHLGPPILQVLRAGLPSPVGPASSHRAGPTSSDRGPEPCIAALADGAALVINDAQELWPPLQVFCDVLAVGLGTSATADLHVSLRSGPGLVDHVALDDAFVLQVAGTPRWNVSGWASVADHRAPDRGAAPRGGPVDRDVELAPGECLTIPRGFTCSSRSGTGPTLSLVIWADGRPMGSGSPRRPGERFWVGDGRPGHPSLAGVPVEDLTVETKVVRRSGVVVWTAEVGDHLVVRTDRRELLAPAWTSGWARRLLSGPAVSAAELAPRTDRPAALVLVERLVRLGILAVA
jgi:hypothetical protein